MQPIYRRTFLSSTAAAGVHLVGSRTYARAAEKPRSTGESEAIVIGKRIDDIEGFDPHESVSSSAIEIIGNIYETLVFWDGDSRFRPGLAKVWSSSDGDFTWTFQIASGRRFSSGMEVTADDVVGSFKRIFALAKAPAIVLAPLGITSDNVKDVIKTNNATEVIFRLPQGAATRLLLPCLTAAVCSIIDMKSVELNRSTDSTLLSGEQYVREDQGESWLRFNSAGSGPFYINDAVRTDNIELKQNCFFGLPRKIKSIRIRNVSGTLEQRVLLEKNEIQIARNLSGSDESARDGKENSSKKTLLVTTPFKKANLLLLCMNVSTPAFASPDVRKAIRYAIDVESLAMKLNSKRWSAQRGFSPSALRWSSNNPTYDRDLAKSILKKAGWSGFEVVLSHMSGNPRSEIAEGLVDQLAAIDLTVRLKPEIGRNFIDVIERRAHQFALVEWNADYADPHSNAHTFCVNDGEENGKTSSYFKTMAWYSSWYRKDITEMANAAGVEKDDAKRQAIYDEIEKGLMEFGPYVFLMEETDILVSRQTAPQLSVGLVDSFTRFPIS